MALISLAVLAGAGVFVIGLVLRARKVMLAGAPAALLLVIWFFLASSRPDPQKEFGRLFGAANMDMASDIRTIKPTFMDGHYISFRMRSDDFNTRVRPLLSRDGLGASNILFGQPLPAGWPSEIETTAPALHREVNSNVVYLLYFPDSEMAYASVRYDQW